MSDMGFTPNLVASAEIRPFRFVKMSATSWTGTQCAAITDQCIGVSDGSIYQFTAGGTVVAHAVAGGPINLQPSNTVQIEAGAAITAGDYLMADATSGVGNTGRAVLAAGVTAVSNYIALENATAAGDIIRAYRFGQRGPIFA